MLVSLLPLFILCSFFFNDPATTDIYTLSLHDALPIFRGRLRPLEEPRPRPPRVRRRAAGGRDGRGDRDARPRPDPRADQLRGRSEEHTSELQSQSNLVCRLLLEKKKKNENTTEALRKP